MPQPMPRPPDVGPFTRWVLENPWPAGVLLAALAGLIAWRAPAGAARRRHLLVAGALAIAGAAVLVAGRLVVTAGEHARALTRSLLDAVVAGDVAAASAHFAGDATLSFGTPDNPGLARAEIEARLKWIEGRYRVASNQITALAAYTESSDRATVHLACSTTTEEAFGPIPSQWVLEVRRQPDGSWRITRVTWISLAGQRVTPGTGR